MKELELYIHIPFCIQKCYYCDFLSGSADESTRQEYVDSLCKKIRSYGELAKAYHVVSIFIGGGTPSVLMPKQTEQIFRALRDTFAIEEDAEITIEVNPGTVTKEKLFTYRALGINRLSIGLQSVHNEELKLLGRIHTYEEFLETYELARSVGFANINIDLISAIPGQTVESWQGTLRTIAALAPEHISAYSLIVEEGTPFSEWYGEAGTKGLPDEEAERQMYQDTKQLLEEYGYDRYEISNYAKEGYVCRHNLGYWDRREYLGVGIGAASLIGEERWTEGASLDAFVRGEGQMEVVKLSNQEQMEEFMFLGLRKMQGVSKKTFAACFDREMEAVYGEIIRRMCERRLLEMDGEMLRLTERGIDVSNYVMSEFLLDET